MILIKMYLYSNKFNIFNMKKAFIPSINPSKPTNTECLKQCRVLPSFLFIPVPKF